MPGIEISLDEITGAIVDAAYHLHTKLGPGLLESVYEVVLARDLGRRGFRAARQEPGLFEYEGLHFRAACASTCWSNPVWWSKSNL